MDKAARKLKNARVVCIVLVTGSWSPLRRGWYAGGARPASAPALLARGRQVGGLDVFAAQREPGEVLSAGRGRGVTSDFTRSFGFWAESGFQRKGGDE